MSRSRRSLSSVWSNIYIVCRDRRARQAENTAQSPQHLGRWNGVTRRIRMILLDISVGAPGTPATAGERAFGALLFVTILRDARARPGERLFRRGDLTVELRLVELAVQRAEVGAGRRNGTTARSASTSPTRRSGRYRGRTGRRALHDPNLSQLWMQAQTTRQDVFLRAVWFQRASRLYGIT